MMLLVFNPPMLANTVAQKFVVWQQGMNLVRNVYRAFFVDHIMALHCYDVSYRWQLFR